MNTPDLPIPIQIREMRSEDLEQVQRIDRISFTLPWPTSAYNYELHNPMSLSWVAEIREEARIPRIVGMIVVWLIVDEAHIATLAVSPDFRRQGIGKVLLATALMEVIRKGMREATLEVRANNLAAQRLYQHFRFEIYGFRPRYYRDNSEDALIMTNKNLDTTYLDWLENETWKSSIELSFLKLPASTNDVNSPGEELQDGKN